ncbi:MAG TPA: aminoglycoside phosphotransferase family protein [Anaerolineales bacterium]
MEEEVIEKPDIPDEAILRAVEAGYGIRADGLEFIPHGLDSFAWAYRVRAGAAAYFLKGSRRPLPETGAWVPQFLAERGVPHVIAPILTRQGEVQAQADGFNLRLQPFVTARSAIEAGMALDQWMELGAFLRQLHNLRLPASVRERLRQEDFMPRRLAWVSEMNARIGESRSEDAIATEMISSWRERRESVGRLIERMNDLTGEASQMGQSMVVCHADIHTANILLAADGAMFVVDWEDAMLAPKERDLMFVLAYAEPAQWASFLKGYATTYVDAVTLAYYQHAWAIEDLGAFAEEILDVESAGAETRANSLRWFKHLFTPAGSVPIALEADLVSTHLHGKTKAAEQG